VCRFSLGIIYYMPKLNIYYFDTSHDRYKEAGLPQGTRYRTLALASLLGTCSCRQPVCQREHILSREHILHSCRQPVCVKEPDKLTCRESARERECVKAPDKLTGRERARARERERHDLQREHILSREHILYI
jgi:hypothetical protein